MPSDGISMHFAGLAKAFKRPLKGLSKPLRLLATTALFDLMTCKGGVAAGCGGLSSSFNDAMVMPLALLVLTMTVQWHHTHRRKGCAF